MRGTAWVDLLTPFCRPRARLYGAAWSLYRFGYNGLTIDRYQGSADMAVTQAIPMTRHPYADGSYKKMLIDGKWTDAASGKRFETHNPATGELLATIAEGDAEDINRAVAAARRAFEGPWSKVKPYERQALLLKLADLVEKNFDELATLDTLDMGRRSAAPAAPNSVCSACSDIMRGRRPRCTARPSRTRCPA